MPEPDLSHADVYFLAHSAPSIICPTGFAPVLTRLYPASPRSLKPGWSVPLRFARVTSHIPDKGQVTVRYYGHYANAHIYRSSKASVCGG
jgi:hypothetical protein